MIEVLTLPIWKTSTCLTRLLGRVSLCPDLPVFCRLDELGLVVAGHRIDRDRAVLACRVVVNPMAPMRGGVGAVAARGHRVAACPGDSRMSLATRPQAGCDAVEVVAMDGFTGFKTATSEDFPTRSR